MRIKTLTRYNFSAIRNAILIFSSLFIGATLWTSFINASGMLPSWSTAILGTSLFMLFSSFIGSQKDTRFLISRCVSRKEIFIANAMFLYPLAAIISTLQIIGIHIDGFIRWLVSSEWRGLELDFQILQAPDMKNIGVFFIVTFSILLVVGSISYLVGSLIARWKNQTIIAATILALLSLALIGSTDLMARIIDIFTFMFTDDTTGLMIVLKQIILSTLVMAIAFPIMRKIPAARQ